MSGGQLRMFGLGEEAQGPLGPADHAPQVASLAARLPGNLYLGTSSWSFPGWEGIVYDRRASEQTLARHGLAAYARHPLFRTVGVDRTYYAPVEAEAFAGYAAAVPATFRFLVKAYDALTAPFFAERRGERPAGENRSFLDPGYATDVVVGPYVEGLGAKGGVLLFQFSPLNLSYVGGAAGFATRLRRFLLGLPSGPRYAVELRNDELLAQPYVEALREAGAIHCLNAHPRMPPVVEQARRLGAAFGEAPAVVVRWMLARRFDYSAAKERYRPFDRIVDVDSEARGGICEVVGAEDERPVMVVVNNKAEGSSPLSVRALAERLVR